MARLRSRDTTPAATNPQPAVPAPAIGYDTASTAPQPARQTGRRPGRPKAQPSPGPTDKISAELEAALRAQNSPPPAASDTSLPFSGTQGRVKAVARPMGHNNGRLEAVAEEANAFGESQTSDHAAPNVGFEDAVESQADFMRSPGGQSTFSGTTAVTSHSQNAVRRLSSRKQQLFDELPLLHDQSSMLLRDLAHDRMTKERVEQIANELKMPAGDSAASRRLSNRITEFRDSFDAFSHDDHFIHPEYFLDALFQVRSRDDTALGAWRPDDLLYKANLAELVYQLMTLSPDAAETSMNLLALDNNFPAAFASYVYATAEEPGCSRLLNLTFDIALGLRTQYAIACLRSAAANDDPALEFEGDNILRQIFFVPNRKYEMVNFKGWNVNTLQDSDGTVTPGFRIAVLERYNSLAAHLRVSEDSSGDPDIDAMVAQYPWTSFLHDVTSWACTRNMELTSAISRAGGADQIVASLSNVTAGSARKPDMDIEDAQELANMIQQMNNQVSATGQPVNVMRDNLPYHQPQSANQFDYISGDGQHQPLPPGFGESTGQGEILQVQHQAPVPNMASQIGAQRSQAARKGRGKARLDEPQAGAQRVMWDASQASEGIGGDGVDPTQDDGFQQQNAPADEIADRRKKASGMSKRKSGVASKKRPRESGEGYENIDELESHRPSQRHRANKEIQDNADDPPADAEPPASNYPEIQQAAKRQGAISQAGSKQPQKRNPWSTVEVDQLQWLITLYGTSWSVLKKKDVDRGHKLEGRDQVALKDKARNMKADYLSQQIPLPQHFELIPLSKKEIDRVKSRLGPDWVPR